MNSSSGQPSIETGPITVRDLIESIRAEKNGAEIIDVLLRLHINLLKASSNPKVRRIRSAVPKLQETIFCSTQAQQVLESLGWVLDTTSETGEDGVPVIAYTYNGTVNALRVKSLFTAADAPMPDVGSPTFVPPPPPKPFGRPKEEDPDLTKVKQQRAEEKARREQILKEFAAQHKNDLHKPPPKQSSGPWRKGPGGRGSVQPEKGG